MPDADLRSRREALVREHIRAEMAADLDATLATFARGASYDIVADGIHARDNDGVRALLTSLLTTFPDLGLHPLKIHHADECVLVEGRMTGTMQAAFGPYPATQAQMDIRAAIIFRFDGEVMVEEVVYYDRLTMFEQLGVAP